MTTEITQSSACSTANTDTGPGRVSKEEILDQLELFMCEAFGSVSEETQKQLPSNLAIRSRHDKGAAIFFLHINW